MKKWLGSEAQMIAFGASCAANLSSGQVVFLQGELGTGKTTFAKGILSTFGYSGVVNSPTFSLVQSYDCDDLIIHHFDLYRMESVVEFEMIGAREMFNSHSLCLLEWPEKAAGILPRPDLQINIEYHGAGRQIYLNSNANG